MKVDLIYENLENHKFRICLEWGNLMYNIHFDNQG
jgi:hypothetical protein